MIIFHTPLISNFIPFNILTLDYSLSFILTSLICTAFVLLILVQFVFDDLLQIVTGLKLNHLNILSILTFSILLDWRTSCVVILHEV